MRPLPSVMELFEPAAHDRFRTDPPSALQGTGTKPKCRPASARDPFTGRRDHFARFRNTDARTRRDACNPVSCHAAFSRRRIARVGGAGFPVDLQLLSSAQAPCGQKRSIGTSARTFVTLRLKCRREKLASTHA